jgi:hypothetical protein
MSDMLSGRAGVAASFARSDAARAEVLLQGLTVERDAPGALLVFISKAALTEQDCANDAEAAHARGTPIIAVLLDRLSIPGDLPESLAKALLGCTIVEAFDEPDEAKRGVILRALAALGIAGAAAGVAEAGSMSAAQTRLPQSSGAESSASAKALHIDPLAKSTANVVKASSRFSTKTIAFGGAAAATVLVVGAIVLMQKSDRAAAPARSVSGAASTASAAKDAKDTPPTPVAPTPAPTELASNARAILQETSYPAGKPIPVRVENMPGNDTDFIAIAEVGAPGSSHVRYEYLRGKKDAEVTLRAVMTPGDYEVRIFFGSGDGAEREKIRFSVPLTITPAAPITLQMDSQRVTEGQPLRIRYDGMPGNSKDWIASAKADADGGTYIKYVYTNGAASGVAELPPFVKAGQYEIRAYFDDLTSDRTVQARIPVEVIPAPPVTLSLDAATYAPGAPITVTFADMPGNRKDWLALARPDDSGYLSYEYLDARTSGTKTLRAPEEPGIYEIRGYFDDATGDKTVRAKVTFTVGDAAVTAPIPGPTPEQAPETPAATP